MFPFPFDLSYRHGDVFAVRKQSVLYRYALATSTEQRLIVAAALVAGEEDASAVAGLATKVTSIDGIPKGRNCG